jgi:hypothetical protein
MIHQTNVERVAVARARAALDASEAAQSPSAKAAARVELEVSRRALLLVKAEGAALSATRQAMAKSISPPVGRLALRKAAGVRRPGGVSF